MLNVKFDELVKHVLKSWFHVDTVISHAELHKSDVFRYVRENHRQALAENILHNDRFFRVIPSETDIFTSARTDVVLLSHDEVIQALKDAYRLGFEDAHYRSPIIPPLYEDGKKC